MGVEPGQDGSQTQGHRRHLGPLGGYQGHEPQGQQGQVFQQGDPPVGKQQGLSQGLLKGSKAVEPGQGKSQAQGHCHWGQGHCQWGPLGGYQGQVHQGQQGQVFQEGGPHLGNQQGLSQGLLKGSKVGEPGQGRSQTQGHCHWGQGHCHWGSLGGYQSQVHQGQQAQVSQEGDPHMGKQQGLSLGLLKGSTVVEPCQGRGQNQGHCHWTQGHCKWGPQGGHQGQVHQGQQGQVFQAGEPHMGKQQGLPRGLLKKSKVVEPGQGRGQTQGHCHWGQDHCQWGPLGG